MIGHELYQKKIIPYLDGSLSPEDKSEFEVFVATHPDFETELRKKQNELAVLRQLIPAVVLSKETSESLDSEIKLSVFNLLKSDHKNMWGRMRDKFEEWTSR